MRIIILVSLLAAPLAPAGAQETVTYSYDAKGRLTQAARSGTANNGVVTAYAFDKADNRTSLTVTGSPFSSAPQRVIVLPLNGLTPVAIPTP